MGIIHQGLEILTPVKKNLEKKNWTSIFGAKSKKIVTMSINESKKYHQRSEYLNDIIFIGGNKVGTGYFRNVGNTQRMGAELAFNLDFFWNLNI